MHPSLLTRIRGSLTLEGDVPPLKGDVTRVCPSLEEVSLEGVSLEGWTHCPSHTGLLEGGTHSSDISTQERGLPHPSSREGHTRVTSPLKGEGPLTPPQGRDTLE